jgi:hypothetical protein
VLDCKVCGAPKPSFRSPLLTQACRDASVGSSDAANPVCTDCTEQRCCETRAAYNAFEERGAFRDCFDPCLSGPDGSREACKTACYALFPRALVEATLQLFQCAQFVCADECGVAQTCENGCYRTSCADALAACGGNVECNLLSDCVPACASDPFCVGACYAKYPSARSLFSELSGCIVSYCSTRCR